MCSSDLQLLATDIRFARPKPSHRLALVVRLAALQHAQPDVPWTGVLLTRAASSESAKASTTEFGFRFRGDEAARCEAALAVLRMAAQMAMWSFRDAVPFLGDTSRSLAERDIDGAYEAFEKVNDAWESLLWAGLSPREMLDAPITRDDPAVIVPYLPSEWADEPDGIALDSRVAATAEWVWRTVNDAIEQIDSSGNPVTDAEVPEIGRAHV